MDFWEWTFGHVYKLKIFQTLEFLGDFVATLVVNNNPIYMSLYSFLVQAGQFDNGFDPRTKCSR